MRPDGAPAKEARPGSSTTARIATPVRVRRKNTRRKIATAMATATVMSCSHDRVIPATETGLPFTRSGVLYVFAVGLQMAPAAATSTRSRPRVTANRMLVAAPYNWRITTRSTTIPSIGAATNKTMASDSSSGSAHPCHSCQNRYAMTMPMAPWAKLKMPVVLYVTTRPLALTA
jgi:hypothetical protein